MMNKFMSLLRTTLKESTASWSVCKTNMQSTYDKIQYYELDSHQKEELISKLKGLLAKEKKVKTAWIFGSFTKSNTVRDIDIAVNTDPDFSFAEYLSLNAHLELEIGLPVDLMEIKKAPQSLKERIYSGTLIKE
jgi:predicted nucleotidyltransferase